MSEKKAFSTLHMQISNDVFRATKELPQELRGPVIGSALVTTLAELPGDLRDSVWKHMKHLVDSMPGIARLGPAADAPPMLMWKLWLRKDDILSHARSVVDIVGSHETLDALKALALSMGATMLDVDEEQRLMAWVSTQHVINLLLKALDIDLKEQGKNTSLDERLGAINDMAASLVGAMKRTGVN